ncbi:MAG: 23S rRNA (uracil(1939)-C(5))-methyltransferase RlmD [Lachnospiraceae bacterium]|nr:23S rRNA (uracil(1939)-C(5))-methyltransferase RlmD [Lachnospiraceae bacterium]
MKKGEIYEAVVDSYEFPNKGIIHMEDTKIIVKNTLPGQLIRFRLTKKRHDKATGLLIDIIKKSEIENGNVFCEKFGICGSCLYQSMKYEEQLELKKNLVLSLINKVDNNYIFDGIKHSPISYGYRNKMEFTFGDEYKDGPLSLGLHKRGSFYDIIDASDCKLVNKDYGMILKEVLNYCTENNLSHYHRMSHEGYLRHLLIRRTSKTNELLIDIVTTTTVNHDFSQLVNRLVVLPLEGNIQGILHTVNDSVADTITDQGTTVLYGKDYFYEEILGLKFKITPFSFFQTNSLGAEVLYETARSYIKEYIDNKVIYDLYSGTGTIAQLLAPVANKVIGVEIIPEAVASAKENAKLNNIDNCEFIAGDVLKTLDSIDTNPELIVLDPPREGVHPKALDRILDYGVDNILYISCKPTSLIKDIEIIKNKNYKLERVSIVDMFPWTAHVETIALFSKIR